jgi:hypothetical protein
MTSEAGEASEQPGAPSAVGRRPIDRHHSREYHQTWENASGREKNAIEARRQSRLAHHSLEPLPPQYRRRREGALAAFGGEVGLFAGRGSGE